MTTPTDPALVLADRLDQEANDAEEWAATATSEGQDDLAVALQALATSHREAAQVIRELHALTESYRLQMDKKVAERDAAETERDRLRIQRARAENEELKAVAERDRLRGALESLVPEVGSVWVWEPERPRVRSRCTVVTTRWNGEEWMIESRVDDSGMTYWNTLGRWMEACVLVLTAEENVALSDPIPQESREDVK
jgi:hypothetical protein